MGEIFKSSIPCDASKFPNVPLTDYIFQSLQKVLPQVDSKPWIHDMTTGKTVLFGEVEIQAKAVASALTKRGFAHGDYLYFVCHDIVDMAVLQVAVWMLGGVTRGSYQQEFPAEFARQMQEIECKFVAVDARTAPSVREAIALTQIKCELINVGDEPVEGAIEYTELARDDSSGFPTKVEINPKEDYLLICNTSGSTGNPKGVIHTHHNFLSSLAWLDGKYLSDINESNFLTAGNFAISFSWTMAALLCSGNTLFGTSKYNKEDIVRQILTHKPTKIFLYPYIAGWFARRPEIAEHDFSFIKSLTLGGSVADPTTVQLLEKTFPHAHINPAYASTECMGVTSAFNSAKFSAPLYSTTADGETMVTSGFLFPAVQAKLLDIETGKLKGRKEIGKLLVKTPFLMKGYLAEGKKADRSDIDGEGWFNTGDIAFFDDKGQLFIRERASFMFKYYMHYVNPSEIEAVLLEHPSVAMACVIGMPNEETTNLAKALVVLKEGQSAAKQDLLKLVEEKLPDYKHLHGGLQFVESLPENRGRKLDRVAIWKKYCNTIFIEKL